MKVFPLCFGIVYLIAIATQALAYGQKDKALASPIGGICEDPPADSIDPPAGSIMLASILVSGDRIWECNNGTIIDPNLIKGEALGYGEGWDNGFYYSNDTPPQSNLFFNSLDTWETISMLLSTEPTIVPQEGRLSDARWEVESFLDPPAYPPSVYTRTFDQGTVGYLTRTNTTGGMTPIECPDPEATEINVPFTGNLTLYVCSGGVSGVAGMIATAAFAGALALLVV